MAMLLGKSRELACASLERSRFVMVSDNYFAGEAVYHCRIGANSKCRGGKDKRQMDLSLLFLHRQGLAGRPSDEDHPTCRLQGFSRRSGRFPALPYPPLKQMGWSQSSIVLRKSVSRFRFPEGL